MTTQEIAIKYGVPMPETCKDLDWKGYTFFVWYKEWLCLYTLENGRYILRSAESGEVICDTSFFCGNNAPQMHEIAPLLPKTISRISNVGWRTTQVCELCILNEIKKEEHRYNYTQSSHGFPQLYHIGYVLVYEITHRNGYLYTLMAYTENYHYAEAYAQMYLKLKSENLL